MSLNALTKLTENYTDSENEDDHEEEKQHSDNSNESQVIILSRPTTPTKVQSEQSTPTKAKSGLRLVNYHDDTVLSDDEGASPPHDGEVEKMEVDDDKSDDQDKENELHESSEKAAKKQDRFAEYGFHLPTEAKGKCPQDLQEKISNMYDKMRTHNMDMNKLIQERKEFRNPSIYEKLIQFCEIDELGTNYPPELYDPLQWTGKESTYEELALVQKHEMEKREKDMSKQDVKKTEDDSKKRKSKWDQPAPSSVTVQQSIKPSGLITTSITGTKGTVISAFGSLPKKPKP